jgi:KUP system potassium uptake protein
MHIFKFCLYLCVYIPAEKSICTYLRPVGKRDNGRQARKKQQHQLVKATTSRVTAAGLLIALGIIYGDIGTSPLYVLNAVTKDRIVTDELILGTLSCVIWTLTLQTTIKYVILTLRADNRGEGGIFSLYTLVRRRKKWLVIPAMLGGAALLADGMITPPISVTSAVEGLRQLSLLL